VTTVLAAGTLIVAPADAGLLAVLCREGVLAIGSRRSLPPRASALLAAVEQAAAAARSAAGTTVMPQPPRAASWATVEEAAEVLSMSPSYVRRLCRTEKLVADRRGPAWLVDADSLAGYALSRAAAS
jgi:hypothetical protein